MAFMQENIFLMPNQECAEIDDFSFIESGILSQSQSVLQLTQEKCIENCDE